MSDSDWYDDRQYEDAVRRADRTTRFGWAAIAGTAGALGCALIAAAVACAVIGLLSLFLVVGTNY
ncbi:hypothetical protein [Streptomyces mayteni]